MIGNLATYAAELTSGESRTDVAVIFACDAFGLSLINNKIIPGRLADSLGCTVFIPDLLEGDYPPLDIHTIDEPISQKSWLYQAAEVLKVIWGFVYKIGPRWGIRHLRSKVQILSEDFAKALREEKQLKKIGVIGYCMGGVQSCILAGTDLVDVAVVAHPAPLFKENFDKVNVPISLICSECLGFINNPIFTSTYLEFLLHISEDWGFPASVKKMAQEIISSKDLSSEFKTYPGTTHGFAARPNMAIPEVREGFQRAIEQAINWFKLHLLSS